MFGVKSCVMRLMNKEITVLIENFSNKVTIIYMVDDSNDFNICMCLIISIINYCKTI